LKFVAPLIGFNSTQTLPPTVPIKLTIKNTKIGAIYSLNRSPATTCGPRTGIVSRYDLDIGEN